MRTKPWSAGAGLLLVLVDPAFAHTAIEGVGDFYNGLLHPLWVPTHVLALIALGLLLGQQGGVHVRHGLPAFAMLLALGLVVSANTPPQSLDIMILASGAVTGGLVAAASSLPKAVTVGLCLFTGVCIGLDSNANTLPVLAQWVTGAGAWIAASFVVLWFFGLADTFQRRWHQLGIRIGGAWISAAAIMVLALSAR